MISEHQTALFGKALKAKYIKRETEKSKNKNNGSVYFHVKTTGVFCGKCVMLNF